jgi:hypothetical protein
MTTRQQAEERVQMGFWIHLAAYVLVVGGLAVLNYTLNPDNLWVLWVAGGWGIGIVAHAIAFTFADSHDRMVERTQLRLDRREARHEERDMTDRMSQASH